MLARGTGRASLIVPLEMALVGFPHQRVVDRRLATLVQRNKAVYSDTALYITSIK